MDIQWSNTTRTLVVVIILAAAVWLAVVAAPLLQAVGIAALLAYLLEPAVSLVIRTTGTRRSWATGIVFSLFLLAVVGIPALLGTIVAAHMHRIEVEFLEAMQEVTGWLSQPIVILNFSFHPQELLGNLPVMAGDALATLPGGSLIVLSSVTTNLLWVSVILIALYYFLKDGSKIKPWLTGLVPADHQAEIRRLLDEVDNVWGKFLRAQLLIFFILALLAVAGTLLVVWLFRAGHLDWSFWGFALLLLLVYVAVQQVDNFWLRPQFLGKRLRLHPGVVFVALIGALALSGVLAALVIVPVIATVRVVGRYVHRKLLGLPPWPEAETLDDDGLPGGVDNAAATRPPAHRLRSLPARLYFDFVAWYWAMLWRSSTLRAGGKKPPASPPLEGAKTDNSSETDPMG